MSPRLASISKPARAGKQQPEAPLFLAIGKLRRPHGVHGEIIMEIFTDFPERLQRGKVVYIGDNHQEISLHSVRPNNTTLLVSFAGYTTPETVGIFRNQIVFVPAVDRPTLPEGEYYHHQIIGLKVITDEGQALGVVNQILETGANDVCVVRPAIGSDILLPLIDPVVLQINLEKGEMLVHLLPGLIDGVDNERDDEPPADNGTNPEE